MACSGGADLPVGGDARVMQRSPIRGEDAAKAAGEGTGDDSDGADDDDGNGAASHDRHSGVGRNPEGAGASPAPQNPADVPLDRHFIRF